MNQPKPNFGLWPKLKWQERTSKELGLTALGIEKVSHFVLEISWDGREWEEIPVYGQEGDQKKEWQVTIVKAVK